METACHSGKEGSMSPARLMISTEIPGQTRDVDSGRKGSTWEKAWGFLADLLGDSVLQRLPNARLCGSWMGMSPRGSLLRAAAQPPTWGSSSTGPLLKAASSWSPALEVVGLAAILRDGSCAPKGCSRRPNGSVEGAPRSCKAAVSCSTLSCFELQCWVQEEPSAGPIWPAQKL